jgi:hypothetical protein
MGLMAKILVAVVVCGIAIPQNADAQSRRRKNVVRLAGEDVKGSVQKPELQIFMGRQNLSASAKLDLRESFLPRIIESVEKKPF